MTYLVIQRQQIKQLPQYNTKKHKNFQLSYLDFITFYKLFNFCLAEQHELLMLNHLGEMLLGKELGGLHQVKAIVSFGKVTNTQTVGGIELTLQKIATCSFHP